MWVYLVSFALSFWPLRSNDAFRLTELSAIAADVASTDASAREALILMNIAALESNFNRRARGRHGERGAFQVMPPASSYGAKEALLRLRRQGLRGYCGCVRPCPELIAHRQDRAILWMLAFDPPRENTDPNPETLEESRPPLPATLEDERPRACTDRDRRSPCVTTLRM